MSTKMHIEDHFPCSARRFLELILDPEFDKAAFDEINMKKEYLEVRETPNGLYQKIRMIPTRDLPGFMKKIVGKSNHYTEIREWDFDKMMNNWSEKAGFVTNKIDISGDFHIYPEGENACRRTVDGIFTVKIPLIGSKIEKFIIKQTTESFRHATAFTKRWLKEKGLEGK